MSTDERDATTGPTGLTVAANLARIRDQRGLSLRKLAALLGELGWPVNADSLNRAEKGRRQVTADDLVALALALGVNPNRLLLPVGEDPAALVRLTPVVETDSDRAWNWASGRAPLLIHADTAEKVSEEYDDFYRHAWPAPERLANEHTAARAARDVANRLHEVLQGQPDRAAALRRALARLIAEVDDLTEDDDGQRQ